MALPRFSSRVLLAPMAGISDPAHRLLCKRNGAGLVATEFTSIHHICRSGKPVPEVVPFSEEERPVSIQLFGSDVDALAEAARLACPYFDIVDYNMGCPAPHITRQMAGGALLQEADLTRRIFRILVEASSRPVTLKMRAGTDEGTRMSFLEIARIAEEEGIQMITLHPRTVSQGYAGVSDWGLIKLLKRRSGLPIVGNGDIQTPEDAKRMIDETGCDYVMVGRAATGNPRIFKQINSYLKYGRYDEQSVSDRLDLFAEYYELARGYGLSLSSLKRHAMNFVRGARDASLLRARIAAARSVEVLLDAMRAPT